MKNGTPLWREAHLQVKMHKTPHSPTNFSSSRLEKWHAAVARSAFSSQNAQAPHSRRPIFQVPIWKNGTPLWHEAHFQVKMHKHHIPGDQFFKFRSGKMARDCGAKRIFKSKCTKHLSAGQMFDVTIWKNGTPAEEIRTKRLIHGMRCT